MHLLHEGSDHSVIEVAPVLIHLLAQKGTLPAAERGQHKDAQGPVVVYENVT